MRYRLSPTSLREITTGAVIGSATVTVYKAGGSVLATCYADTTTATPLTGSQTTTTSSGYFEFYVDGADYSSTQKFKIVISKAGYSDITYDQLSIIQAINVELNFLDFLPYGYVTDGSVDYSTQLATAITKMETNGGGTLVFPAGTWRFDSTQYLDSSNTNLTYHFKGMGKGTIIKPYGFTVSDIQRSDYGDGAPSGFLFKLNENSAGNKVIAFPRHPRAIFEDMRVDGNDSAYGGFLWFNEASPLFRNIDFDQMLIGATGVGYTDEVRMEGAITWRRHRNMVVTGTDSNKYICVIDHISSADNKPVTGSDYLQYWALTTLAATHTWTDNTEYIAGWLLKMKDYGDGLSVNSVFTGTGGSATPESSNTMFLQNCAGANISNAIGGRFVFVNCAGVTFQNAHLENSRDDSAAQGSIRIHSSDITLRDNYMWNWASRTGYPIIIDDNIGNGASDILLDNNIFAVRRNTMDTLPTSSVYIKRLNKRGRLRLHNNRESYERTGRLQIYKGLTAGADDVSTSLIPNTLFSDNKHILSGDIEISSVNDTHTLKRLGDALGVWNFPALGSPANATVNYNANITPGIIGSNATYYYKYSIYNSIGNTQGSATLTATTPVSPSGFESNDTHGWGLSVSSKAGLVASIAASTDAPVPTGIYHLKLTQTNGGTIQNLIKLYRQNVPLTAGTQYKIVFNARAASAKSIRLRLFDIDTGVSQGLDTTINLTVSNQAFSETFTAVTTQTHNQVEFQTGGDNINCYFDDIDVQTVSGSTSVLKWVNGIFTVSSCTNSFIRLWRGNSDFVADRYVDIPTIVGQVSRMYDNGEVVNGYPWITTSIPSVPTVNTAFRGSYDGTNKTIWASAAPTAGAWADGDKVFYTDAVAAGFIGAVCTTAGSPGTWKTWGAISA